MREESIKIDKLRVTGLKPDKGFVDTVDKYGVLQNIVVEETKDGYRVLAGRRRVEAAREIGHDVIRAIIIDGLDAEDKALVTLIENMKKSPNPAVEAKAIAVLQKKGNTQAEIAKVLGVERSQVAKRALLLKLTPKLFKKLEDGSLLSSIARELAQLPTKEQEQWAKRDTVTLKEVQEARRLQTLGQLTKAEVDRIEPLAPALAKVEVPITSNSTEYINRLKEEGWEIIETPIKLQTETGADTVPLPTPDTTEGSNSVEKSSSTPIPKSMSKSVPGSHTTPDSTVGSNTAPVIEPNTFDLTEGEKGVLEHAYRSGLLKPGKGKLPPMDEVAESYGMKKKTYSKALVNARRKILTGICGAFFDS